MLNIQLKYEDKIKNQLTCKEPPYLCLLLNEVNKMYKTLFFNNNKPVMGIGNMGYGPDPRIAEWMVYGFREWETHWTTGTGLLVLDPTDDSRDVNDLHSEYYRIYTSC